MKIAQKSLEKHFENKLRKSSLRISQALSAGAKQFKTSEQLKKVEDGDVMKIPVLDTPVFLDKIRPYKPSYSSAGPKRAYSRRSHESSDDDFISQKILNFYRSSKEASQRGSVDLQTKYFKKKKIRKNSSKKISKKNFQKFEEENNVYFKVKVIHKSPISKNQRKSKRDLNRLYGSMQKSKNGTIYGNAKTSSLRGSSLNRIKSANNRKDGIRNFKILGSYKKPKVRDLDKEFEIMESLRPELALK